VAHQLHQKDTLPIPKNGAEQTPNSGSAAAEEAKKMGLQYYGFGRYGKNGKVTHRSIHDRLVEVEQIQKHIEKHIPSVAAAADKPTVKKESIDIDFEELLSEEDKKEPKLLKDKSGKPRIFLLRRAAAKEAHQNGGTVMPYKNGYAIKLNEENQHVKTISEAFWKQTGTTSDFRARNESRRSQPTSIGEIGTGERINEGVADLGSNQEYSKGEGITGSTSQEATGSKTKISISQIRSKQKEKVKESIDCGTEPGLSMATGGENLVRKGSKVKQKEPLEELTGDETTASIGAKKEDELKKVGINLQSFKAKRPL
jgi:hypothetical protein